LGKKGSNKLYNISEEEIKNALNFGQGLASLNCRYVGARGMMYNLNKLKLLNLVNKIMNYKNINDINDVNNYNTYREKSICPNCK